MNTRGIHRSERSGRREGFSLVPALCDFRALRGSTIPTLSALMLLMANGASAQVPAQSQRLCPIDQRTGLDLAVGTRYEWYPEVRYTYAMMIGEIVSIVSYSNEYLPRCSQPALTTLRPQIVWRREITEPMQVITDDDITLLAPGTRVIAYVWERFDLPFRIALVKPFRDAEVEVQYLENSIYERFDVQSAAAGSTEGASPDAE